MMSFLPPSFPCNGRELCCLWVRYGKACRQGNRHHLYTAIVSTLTRESDDVPADSLLTWWNSSRSFQSNILTVTFFSHSFVCEVYGTSRLDERK